MGNICRVFPYLIKFKRIEKFKRNIYRSLNYIRIRRNIFQIYNKQISVIEAHLRFGDTSGFEKNNFLKVSMMYHRLKANRLDDDITCL